MKQNAIGNQSVSPLRAGERDEGPTAAPVTKQEGGMLASFDVTAAAAPRPHPRAERERAFADFERDARRRQLTQTDAYGISEIKQLIDPRISRERNVDRLSKHVEAVRLERDAHCLMRAVIDGTVR